MKKIHGLRRLRLLVASLAMNAFSSRIRFFIPVLLIIGCMGDNTGNCQVIAFPGAEGFGQYTTGGRGGKVYIVTALEDSGTGSLREAVEAKGPRMVVFATSGTIHLQSRLTIKGDITIAGQTAPGDGICLADYPVLMKGNNIIVRYLRFRMGDKNQRGGMVDGNGSDDAFGGSGNKNVIVDHCSISWSTDEVCSVYKGDSTTLQWNLLTEPLHYSWHFEKGDKDYEKHGYGGIWGGAHLSAHHNLFAHCASRNPRFNGARLGAEEELVDFCNNLIYDWGHNSVYGGEGGRYNMVGNYYKYGPNTHKNVQYRIVNPTQSKAPAIPFGKYYVDGNYVDGAPDVTHDNRKGIDVDKQAASEGMAEIIMNKPFAVLDIHRQLPEEAYHTILQHAGASLPRRDTLDERIVKEVKKRTGAFLDVQGGYPHGTPYEQTIGAWPALQAAPAPDDKDKDGMPDEWERKKGLNAAINDAAGYQLDKQYTNIEVYINEITR